jgi:adenylate kinase family enzyme
LLSGEKGSGKSLLAKSLSINVAKVGIPTIVINQNWCGEKFNNFIQSITQPKLVIFDEFEKIYQNNSKEHEQEKLLTLLDGVYGSNTLFVLTCNDPQQVSSAMKNRPGRIYYLIEFNGLEEAFIKEYCDDNLDNKGHMESICSISHLFMGKFNVDMLKAMVEELNRYPGDSPSDVLELLNVKPQHTDECEHKFKLYVNGKLLDEPNMNNGGSWHGNPTYNGVKLECYDQEGGYKTYEFYVADLKHLDAEKGKFVFINEKRERLVLTREADGARGWKHNFPIPTNKNDYTSDCEDEVEEGSDSENEVKEEGGCEDEVKEEETSSDE